jgi:hypothetical protein
MHAKKELWSGSTDMALIKMADAQTVFNSLGNIPA